MTDMPLPPRKPRLALMGEFSAGKSTLTNLLLGTSPLPSKVTATRLSPVWISYGDAEPYRVDVDGTTEPVDIAHLEDIPVEETRVIRIQVESEILQSCDLIDFPGISDPNMDAEVWERVLDEVDAILWCTHATQAWRQSEAAVWEMIPEAVQQKSILVVTRFDKLTSDRDRNRVLARLRHETEDLFTGIYPVELLRALEANEDPTEWEESGAAALLEQIANLGMSTEAEGGRFATLKSRSDELKSEASQEAEMASNGGVMPRRVVPRRVAPIHSAPRKRLSRRDDGDTIGLS